LMPFIITIILIIAFIISISFLVQKRKKTGITGIKTAFTPICFYLIAVINHLAYLFDLMGLLSWTISIILLFLSAYFMKYMPAAKNEV